ncbi:MAG: hypothetical protein JRJ25_08065, partial [Deltaproteobacteria bacterium]|nr:hypothetical protein [Deltaproteobacteria bacterium]
MDLKGREMKPKTRSFNKIIILCTFILFAILWSAVPVFSYPIAFTDVQGNHISITKRPLRVVSLVPGITEIIFRIGAG